MRQTLLAILFIISVATPSISAQTLTSVTFRVYNQGAPSAMQTNVLQMTSFVCNQTPITVTGTVPNPTKISFDFIVFIFKI